MYAQVLLLDPPWLDLSYALPGTFPESFWRPGLRVAVPLGRGPLRPALLRLLTPEAPEGLRLRELFWPLETRPLLGGDLTEILCAVADRQGLARGQAAAGLLPFLRDMRASLHRLDVPGGKPGDRKVWSLSDLRRLPPARLAELADDLLQGRARMVPPRQDAAAGERCVLRVSPPWPLRPGALRQRAALELVQEKGQVNRRVLIRALGPSGGSVVAGLLARGLLAVEEEDEEARLERAREALLPPDDPENIVLNEDQKRAVGQCAALLDRNEASHRLLFGVTGSGKTAVYTAIAREALSRGKSVLLLAPEVALACKLRRDLGRAIPEADIVFSHGYQSRVHREKTFRALAARTDPVLVIGTRSALFLPLPSLGCLILDEEHDASYKQDERVPYQAREVAWLRAARAGALLLLGSATPDIRSWHAALSGHLPVLRLPERVSGRPLPPVELVQMGTGLIRPDQPTILTPRALRALDETVARGEQAIILLNRRGFAPLVYCSDCQAAISCPNCAVGLSFHRDEGRLLCHYCGYSLPFPAPCPVCRHMNFLPMGEGTERTADFLSARFGREVLRFDRDSTRRQGAMEELLARFAAREADILVGTQMLSKGHHFPQVTLAVVADGDLGLSLPDYRAAERTFQLLVQSAGRAGRGEKPGRVLIQTRDLRHYCWRFVQTADYEGFYAEEIRRREKFRFPPFTKLALLRFSYARNDAEGSRAMQEMEAWIRPQARERGLTLLGPVPSPIAVLNGRVRHQCLLKVEDWTEARRLRYDAGRLKCADKLRIVLDLDPVSML